MRKSQRPSRHLPFGLIVAIAALLVAGAGVATGYLTTGGQIRAGANPPDLVPALAGAPWLDVPNGSPSVANVESRPSLRFAAGVDYAEALSALYVSALERGDVPSQATLVDPLPKGKVLAGSAKDGLTLSLVAPFGYDTESGAVRPPAYRLSGELTPAEVKERVLEARDAGRALPEGAQVAVPDLEDCQIVGLADACPVAEGVTR